MMNFFFETKRTGWHESEDFLPFDFVDLSNSLSRSIHFRIIYYISLHSLLKEKETNRPLARFDSNKTLDYSHAKDGDFCEIEKGARFLSLSPSFKREGQFFSRASTRYKLVERLKIRITKAPLCCFGGRVDLFY